jgi:glycine cleavage system H protein
VKQGEVFGTIESVKAVSELFSPASGEVVAVNTALPDHPETVNSNPHGTWMIKLKLDDPAEASSLLDGPQYADLVK